MIRPLIVGIVLGALIVAILVVSLIVGGFDWILYG